MAKRRKKARVKREPKPPTWLLFKTFNQTQEEVYFGVSMTTPKWEGSRYELRGIAELAHWDLKEDKIMIIKIHKRKRYHAHEEACVMARYFERTYVHWRNFWVIQTGKNLLLTPRLRKPVKPPRLPRGYYFDPDLEEEFDEDMEMNATLEEDSVEENSEIEVGQLVEE